MGGGIAGASRIRSWLPNWCRSWVADSAALLFSQFTVVAATSALAILLARHLEPRVWGIFSGFLGLSMALSIFVEFGLTQWLLRELSQIWAGEAAAAAPRDASARAGGMVSASLAFNVALGTTITAAAGAGAVVLGLRAGPAVALVSLVGYGALTAACYGLETVFRARRTLGRLVAVTLLEKGVLLGLVIVSLSLGLGLAAIGLAYLIAGSVHAVVDAVLIMRGGAVRLTFPKLARLRWVARNSFPFALNRASLNVVPLLDTVVLVALAPVAAGYFALGARALGPVLIIPVVMSSALFPFLARESPGSEVGWRVVGLLGALGALIGAIGIALSPQLVTLVFGRRYAHAVPVVQTMLLATPLVFAANPLLTHVYTARLERRRLGVSLGAAALAGTAWVGIGQVLLGPVGAATGYVARQVLFLGLLMAGGGAIMSPARLLGLRRAGAERLPEAEPPARAAGQTSPGAIV